jgi:putative chitinase
MGFAWSADGSTHVQLVERLAVEYGDPTSVALLMEVAAADPVKYPDRAWDAKLAARVLTKVSDTAKADANKQIAAWLAAEAK